jgi:serine/threonine protein phosphatase 1
LTPAPPHPARVPAGTRVYAVGDVHGVAPLLESAIAFIERDRGGRPAIAVFLGDYVDRGPGSRAVVERLARLADGAVTWRFLAGNHEAMMLAFLDRPETNGEWLGYYGGRPTLDSYGVAPPPAGVPSRPDLRAARDRLAAAAPGHHLDFLRRLERWVAIGDYLFVHAGLRPGIGLEAQSDDDLLSIRDDFICTPHWHGRRVVHGHTVTREPVVLPWRIGIDTGANTSGRLCVLVLEDDRVKVQMVK